MALLILRMEKENEMKANGIVWRLVFLFWLIDIFYPVPVYATNLEQYKKIDFAGKKWHVKKKLLPAGPGPNYFSDDPAHIWTDNRGLHLTIKKRDHRWYSTQVISDGSFGYGTYVFIHGRVDRLDPNIVFGLFTWDSSAT